MNAVQFFPEARWRAQLPKLAKQYAENQPFPYIHLENFLDENALRQALKEFPNPGDTNWIQYKHFNENKLGKTKREEFPPLIGALVDELNSPSFLAFLSELIGIPELIADPSLEGGGMHQTEAGGHLNIHADFTMHHHHPDWRRRCNLIVYLNEKWEESWNGLLELWDKDMKRCWAKVPPLFNHCVIFSTTDDSYHGYPDAVKCPKDITRKSVALYYYTLEKDSSYVAKSTDYKARPGEALKSPFIWLDKKAVHLYSIVKKKFGLSDDFASKVLGIFKRKK